METLKLVMGIVLCSIGFVILSSVAILGIGLVVENLSGPKDKEPEKK